MDTLSREKKLQHVTLAGSAINALLVLFKFMAGIMGGSAAMIADAVHSLSDFLTDIVVLVFVHISEKPQDADHDYGHGKYETLATSIIGLALCAVGMMIFYNGASKIVAVMHGEVIAKPGIIALVAALVSIVMKEWAYQFTIRAGRKYESQAVIANAWHHRSDALSSIGTFIGIGGAVLLGSKWAVLDPIAAVIVSVFIIGTAISLIRNSSNDLLEKSLSDEIEDKIVEIVVQEPQVSEVHHLRTRRIGNHFAIEMHVRMPGDISLYDSHCHATNIENRLRKQFGSQTHIGLHVEPVKIGGQYHEPDDEKQP